MIIMVMKINPKCIFNTCFYYFSFSTCSPILYSVCLSLSLSLSFSFSLICFNNKFILRSVLKILLILIVHGIRLSVYKYNNIRIYNGYLFFWFVYTYIFIIFFVFLGFCFQKYNKICLHNNFTIK